MRKKYPMYEVVWEDAASVDEWTTWDNIATVELVTSVGYLVKQVPGRYLVLALSYGDDPHGMEAYSQTIAIPLGMIRKKRRIHA